MTRKAMCPSEIVSKVRLGEKLNIRTQEHNLHLRPPFRGTWRDISIRYISLGDVPIGQFYIYRYKNEASNYSPESDWICWVLLNNGQKSPDLPMSLYNNFHMNILDCIESIINDA